MTATIRVLLCLLFFPAALQAQNQITLTNDPTIAIRKYNIIQKNKGNENPEAHWIKLVIDNPYPNIENYSISLSQPLSYTLYTPHTPGKWKVQHGGLNSMKRQRLLSEIPVTLKPGSKNTLYIKVDHGNIKSYNSSIKPEIILKKALIYQTDERVLGLLFLLCCFALLSFSIYNLYVYFHLKDKTYLYYVAIQIGALLFTVADNLYFNVLFPWRVFSMVAQQNGVISYYELNIFFEHMGSAVIFSGFVEFTRSYLETKRILPNLDKLLKFLAYGYIVLEAIPSFMTITNIYYLDLPILDNIFILIIIVSCITTAVVAHNRKVRVAKHFLTAIFLPAIFTTSASAYIVVYKTDSVLLPAIAILSQIFTFAVALVARIKLINEDLMLKAEESMNMKMEMSSAAYERLLIEQQNLHMKITMDLEKEKNELLQQKLETNQRELMGSSLQMHQKNKLLSELKSQLYSIDHMNPTDKPELLRNMKSSLKENQYLDEKWDDFKLHFEQVHPSFFENLQTAHPSITPYELRLYAYFHINLSTKEIAALLNIAPASVRQAKARLHKKMRAV